MSPPIETQVTAAARVHGAGIAKWWAKLPPEARAGLAEYLTQIIAGVNKLTKAMPPGISPLEVMGPGQQLFGLVKAYECGPRIVGAVLREMIPDLAPLADALETT